MFIDLHCHILPDVDDGAESFSEAVDMITTANKSGTTIMVVTPHYNQHNKHNCHLNKETLTEKYKNFISDAEKIDAKIKFFLGSELFADKNLSELCKTNEIVSLNASRYVLSEFYFDETIANIHTYTDEMMSFGYIPVIAHPERYKGLSQNDYFSLINKGCKFQLNKNSILGKNGQAPKDLSWWMLKNDFVHIIASDCHNSTFRNADLSELYVHLLDQFSPDKINIWMHDNQKRILLDRNI